MHRKLLAFCILFISLSASATTLKLVIDAGHGGTDPGNLNRTKSSLQEKDLNLLISKKLGEYVNSYLGHAIEVIYTRSTDTFIPVHDRVVIANKVQADYFISIHCNSSPKPEVFGTETHIHNLESKVSLDLAHLIEGQFKKRAGRFSRGVKQKNDRLYNLMVLRDSKMPAVLVETGFMTNKDEEAYLNTAKGRDVIASAIFRAFRDFVKKKHNISMQTPGTTPVSTSGPVWKIQIMASTGPVGLTNPDFKSIKQGVEELELKNPTSPFNYKYYVGAFADKKDAKDLLKEIREGVFKDAFIVKFDN